MHRDHGIGDYSETYGMHRSVVLDSENLDLYDDWARGPGFFQQRLQYVLRKCDDDRLPCSPSENEHVTLLNFARDGTSSFDRTGNYYEAGASYGAFGGSSSRIE